MTLGAYTDVLWDDDIFHHLARFQQDAVKSATRIIRDQRGAFVADVVGLGKSFIGAAIVKHFERTDHTRALILCPAPLKDMWERYNERYELNANVLSMGYLREDEDSVTGNILLDDIKYRDRDFLLIDESHNLRNTGTQRYKLVQAYMVPIQAADAACLPLRPAIGPRGMYSVAACVASCGATFNAKAVTKSSVGRTATPIR